ncbi:MAG: hypothetical protein M3P10_04210 [Actinomycetota bacterium]|nr:hypothetical protein [Actinomycetota bacterium]
MRRLSILLLLVLSATVACGDGAAGDGTSGIEGRVTIGPQCPVMQEGSPCPDAPYVATVRVLRDGATVANGRSGQDGSFRISVAPGEYVVDAVPLEENGIAMVRVQPRVVVTAGGYTQVDLSFDSGIR